LAKCLEKVAELAAKKKLSVHMPRIGCGLAGGTWNKVEAIILDKLSNLDISVYVYDLR
jgi:O-acetyl-ADP-ribose deacetylase (regulator of RNase III)